MLVCTWIAAAAAAVVVLVVHGGGGGASVSGAGRGRQAIGWFY